MMCFCNQPCMYKGYKPREENKKRIKKIITLGSCSLYNTLDIEAALFRAS